MVPDGHLGDAKPISVAISGMNRCMPPYSCSSRAASALYSLRPLFMSLNDRPNSSRHDEVEDLRRHDLHRVVAPCLPPPADDVQTLLDQVLMHVVEVPRVVLKIAVHGEDVLTTRHAKSALKRERLPVTSPEREHADMRLLARDPLQCLQRAVGRAVVDEQHLVLAARGGECALDPLDELRDTLVLVADRNDDRESRAGVVHRRSGGQPARRCPSGAHADGCLID